MLTSSVRLNWLLILVSKLLWRRWQDTTKNRLHCLIDVPKLPRQQLPRRLLATQPFARLPTARQNITQPKINKTYFKPDKFLLFCHLTRQKINKTYFKPDKFLLLCHLTRPNFKQTKSMNRHAFNQTKF